MYENDIKIAQIKFKGMALLPPLKSRSIKHLAEYYLDLRFLAASDFFLRFTLGFS